MKITLKSLLTTAAAALLAAAVAASFHISADVGLSMPNEEIYTVSSVFESVPITFDATISLPASQGGTNVIFSSNDGDTAKDNMMFRINANGVPCIAFYGAKSTTAKQTYAYGFDGTDIRGDSPVRITMVRDIANQKMLLYVNGSFTAEADGAFFENRMTKYGGLNITTPFTIGGDGSSDSSGNTNIYSFGGTIYSMAVYSDVRTAEEIAAAQTDLSDENLMAAYDFTTGADILSDRTAAVKAEDSVLYDLTGGASEVTGKTFTKAQEPDTVSQLLETFPATVEATLTMPTTVTDTQRGGIIFSSNDGTGETDFYNLFVDKTGNPWLQLYVSGAGGAYAFKFTEIDVRTDEPMRLSVTFDKANKEVKAYVGGVLKQTVSVSDANITNMDTYAYSVKVPYMVGGDKRTVSEVYNAYAFKGTIYSLAAYSDVRTAEEIAAQQTDLYDENIILAYDFTDTENTDTDLTGNGYDLGEYVPEITYITVSFEANGGSGTMSDVTDAVLGEAYTLPACSFTAPDGKYFAGWAYTADGEVIAEASVTPTENTVLYAIWEDIVLPDEGLTFTQEPYYILGDTLSDVAYTYSAWVYVPKGFEGVESGAIMSSWPNNTDPSINLYIAANGKPSFTYRVGEGSTNNTYGYFNEGVFPYGEWVHIVYAVNSETKKNVTCYINGVADKTITLKNEFDENSTAMPFVLGGNAFPGNSAVFKGAIKEVALYKETLTADEITSLYEGGVTALTESTLIAHYDTANVTEGADIADLSGSGNDLIYVDRWFTEKEEVTGYDYSFAVVGDIQSVTKLAPEELKTLYGWIADNVSAKNIKYVFNLGDIVDTTNGTNTDTEWADAKEAISLLDGVVPYSLLRGNHDLSSKFNEYFGYDAYKDQIDGFYTDGMIDNFYDFIEVGDDKYLHIGLDYGAADDALTWAGGVIEQYPEYRVIITTHAMLADNGEWYTDTDATTGEILDGLNGGGSNNGIHIWDKLVKKYENIELVLCGHDPADDIVVRQINGDNGNKVTVMLIDPQYVDKYWGASGLVAMFYVYSDTNKIEVEYYSTVREKFFKENNQFTVSLADDPAPEVKAAVSLGYTSVPASVKAGDTFTADITAYAVGADSEAITSLDFTVDYDTTKLTLKSIVMAEELGGECISNVGAYAWQFDGVNPPSVSADGTVVATVTFEVSDSLTEADTAILGFDTEKTLNVTLESDTEKLGFTPDIVSSDEIAIEVVTLEHFFITADEYLALAKGTKIFGIMADTNDVTYTLDGKALVYSDNYKAHIIIVADNADGDALAASVTVTETAAEAIDYSGDVNGDGKITAGDAALISKLLHAYESDTALSDEITDIMRLRADIHKSSGNYVTVTDCTCALYRSVGLDHDETV